jgi:hypothetical protein
MNSSTEDASIVTEIGVKNTQQEIQAYAGVDWRKAFNRYLDGIWSQSNQFAEGGMAIETIIIYLRRGEYYIQAPTDLIVSERPEFNRDQIHAVPSDRNSIELGLVKFVRNNLIRMLVVEFGALRLMIWKGESRSELHCTVVDRTF